MNTFEPSAERRGKRLDPNTAANPAGLDSRSSISSKSRIDRRSPAPWTALADRPRRQGRTGFPNLKYPLLQCMLLPMSSIIDPTRDPV